LLPVYILARLGFWQGVFDLDAQQRSGPTGEQMALKTIPVWNLSGAEAPRVCSCGRNQGYDEEERNQGYGEEERGGASEYRHDDLCV
jgi:hypothetical protein